MGKHGKAYLGIEGVRADYKKQARNNKISRNIQKYSILDDHDDDHEDAAVAAADDDAAVAALSFGIVKQVGSSEV